MRSHSYTASTTCVPLHCRRVPSVPDVRDEQQGVEAWSFTASKFNAFHSKCPGVYLPPPKVLTLTLHPPPPPGQAPRRVAVSHIPFLSGGHLRRLLQRHGRVARFAQQLHQRQLISASSSLGEVRGPALARRRVLRELRRVGHDPRTQRPTRPWCFWCTATPRTTHERGGERPCAAWRGR